jgi:hypothetical protein
MNNLPNILSEETVTKDPAKSHLLVHSENELNECNSILLCPVWVARVVQFVHDESVACHLPSAVPCPNAQIFPAVGIDQRVEHYGASTSQHNIFVQFLVQKPT